MPGTYYAAVDEDPLTSGVGSRVIAKASVGTIEGEDGRRRQMAFIGDDAYCSKCKSVGVIGYGAKVNDRHRMVDWVHGGRRQAVGDDIVFCKCSDHPRVIAEYGRTWMIRDDGDAAQELARADASASSTSTAPQLAFDEQVRAADHGANEGHPYYIETADGRTYSGRLKSDRLLPRIATDDTGDYHVYWGDEALAKQHGV